MPNRIMIIQRFSRLIFAKNTSEENEDNSLFVDDIYNCNLTSNLAVLTACESGKPGYQDGEGMIRLLMHLIMRQQKYSDWSCGKLTNRQALCC